jgi:3-oxoacyl-[acyl-carrier-protein] synthase-3
MNGMDVFSFAISTAPKSMKKLAEFYQLNLEEIDYCILHQANMQIDEIIRKKMKFPEEKVPMCLPEFGNTSSASIPLTIVSQLKGKVEQRKTRFLCCGFGIGLSWGSVAFNQDGIVLPQLVEM